MSLDNQTPECFYPPEKNEISPEAQIIINLFGLLKRSQGEEEQRKLATLFYTQLVELITPEGESCFQESPDRLIRIFLEGHTPNNYISVGSGTDGQRIWVKNGISVPSKEEVKRLGKGAIIEKLGEDDYWLRSKDGLPKWMAYYQPSGNSRSSGEKYWNRFMNNFGHPVVDLLQPQ